MYNRLDIAFVRLSGKTDMKHENNLSQARAIVHAESIERLTVGSFKLTNVKQDVNVHLKYQHESFRRHFPKTAMSWDTMEQPTKSRLEETTP